MSAIDDVAAERARQIEKEGWTPEHDDEHNDCCLPVAGACYALIAAGRLTQSEYWRDRYAQEGRQLWPWDEEWLKPKSSRSDLVRAAALIVAEIERLDRAMKARAAASVMTSDSLNTQETQSK
jgi:hypothetical protein